MRIGKPLVATPGASHFVGTRHDDGVSTPVAGQFELGTDGPNVVLVGLDGSRTSWRATAWAAGLARRQGAKLVVVFVQRPSASAAMAPGVAGAMPQVTGEIAAEMEARIGTAAAEMGLRMQFISLPGDPWTELTRIADELRVDAVVVGASESAGHRIIGSLAGRLVRAGRWPVSVVP
jgi:nucleotide-binding universal stress UspA family protein